MHALATLPQVETLPATSIAVQDLLAAFMGGLNRNTLRAYRQSMEDFAGFAGVATVDEAARSLLGQGQGSANHTALLYRASLLERGLSPATVNARLAALRSLVKLARTLGIVAWGLEVASVKSQSYRDTKGPGSVGVRGILKVAKEEGTDKGLRDEAIIRLLHDLGLRRAEVVALDIADVNLEAGTVAILGKGRTEKEALSLPAPTKEALRRWVAVRGSEDGPLFCNLHRDGRRERLSGWGVWYLVKGLGEQVGSRVRPHGIRHTAITEALDATGGNVRAVQRFSRHRDLRTLCRYDDNRQDLGGQVANLVAIEE